MKNIRQLFNIISDNSNQVGASPPKIPGGMDEGMLRRNAMANARRRALVGALQSSPKGFENVSRSMGPTVLDYHLSILEQAGLIGRRNGSVELKDPGKGLVGTGPNGRSLADLEKIEVAEISQLLPCPGDLSRFRITAKITPPLGDGIGLIEPLFPRSKYSERMKAMIIEMHGTMVTLYSSGNVSMTMLKAEDEARGILEEVKSTVNYAISSGSRGKSRVDPMDVNRHLAHTNCGECGEKSCYYFAIKLANGDVALDKCKPLREARYSANRERLETLVGS